jgi:hypothetical protein
MAAGLESSGDRVWRELHGVKHNLHEVVKVRSRVGPSDPERTCGRDP